METNSTSSHLAVQAITEFKSLAANNKYDINVICWWLLKYERQNQLYHLEWMSPYHRMDIEGLRTCESKPIGHVFVELFERLKAIEFVYVNRETFARKTKEFYGCKNVMQSLNEWEKETENWASNYAQLLWYSNVSFNENQGLVYLYQYNPVELNVTVTGDWLATVIKFHTIWNDLYWA